MPAVKFRFGGFELDPAARELRRDGERVPLPPKSFDCLAYLIAHRDRAVGRDELIAAVWGRVDISDTVVAQTMLRARKALGEPGESAQRFVRTVARFGYHWVAPVQEVGAHIAEPDAEPVAAADPSHAIETVSATRPRRRQRWYLAAACAFGIAAIAAWQFRPAPVPSAASATTDASAVLVLPVQVASTQEDDAWMRLGAMDYLASRLRLGGLRAVPSEQALHLSSQLAPARPLDAARAVQLQRLGEVRWVLAPVAERDGRGWRVRLTVFEGEHERVVEARAPSVLAAASAAADSWLRRVRPDRLHSDIGPSQFEQRLQQIDAKLLAGQLVAARRLIDSATPDERSEPALRVREGQLEFRTGRLDEASALFERIAAVAPLAPEVLAKARMGQGAVEIRRNRPALAQAHYAQALRTLQGAERVDDPALLGNAYNGLGVALVQQGRMDDAVRNMGLARVAMQRSGNLIEAASVGINLGMIEQQRHHYPQALGEFDRAIDVFARFDVRDYLAAALMSKAAAQLELVQPDAAQASIARADALMDSGGDRLLCARIVLVRAQVDLARGRLGDVARSIERLRALSIGEDDLVVRELLLRLHLAQGTRTAAANVIRTGLTSPQIPATLALAAVQAALETNDIASASRWRSGIEHGDAAALASDIASGLLARAQHHDAQALANAEAAVARAERSGSPRERVQAGVFKARILRMQGHADAALPVLGDLDAFAASDYALAWETLALYRALHDDAMAQASMARVQALRGERDPAVMPAL